MYSFNVADIFQNIYHAQAYIIGLKQMLLSSITILQHMITYLILLVSKLSIFNWCTLNKALNEQIALLYFFHRNVCISVKGLTYMFILYLLLYTFYVENRNGNVPYAAHSDIIILNHILNTSMFLTTFLCVIGSDTIAKLRSDIKSCVIMLMKLQ